MYTSVSMLGFMFVCWLQVRSIGALGFVLLTSWLLRENILALITINAHASVSYMLAALGINVVPTMPMIYLVFASLVCMTFVSVPFLPPAKMKWNRMPIFGALLKKFSVHGIVEKCTLTSCPCCFSPLTRSQPE
jgi:flagellar biosynthesis protein FlhB